MTTDAQSGAAPWGDMFRDGRALYTILLILGVTIHAQQTLVIAIIMPTIVTDLGGAAYYTWPTMLYTVGTIIGAASVGPAWAALGRSKGFALSGLIFMLATMVCAMAPDMATLNIARTVQGLAGGLVNGGCMGLVSALFSQALRKRVLALIQVVWMVAQLSGPVIGGLFAEIGWWRGSFWVMVPVIFAFVIMAYVKLPGLTDEERAIRSSRRFPMLRLAMLTAGVFAVGLAGPIEDTTLRIGFLMCALVLVGITFKFDRVADNRLYPAGTLSASSPVGLALWIFFIGGLVQTSVMLFIPLLLQVVHGLSPLYIAFIPIALSMAWTITSFVVSGWSGRRENIALSSGPVLMIIGLAGLMLTAQLLSLWAMTLAAVVFGIGMGIHFVPLVARTMANAAEGEEGITASSMPSIRALGTAFGAASAGVLSTMAGLGDATDGASVGNAIVFVFGVNLVPLVGAAAIMFWMVRIHSTKS
jgi:MFS family permease